MFTGNKGELWQNRKKSGALMDTSKLSFVVSGDGLYYEKNVSSEELAKFVENELHNYLLTIYSQLLTQKKALKTGKFTTNVCLTVNFKPCANNVIRKKQKQKINLDGK